MRALIGCLLIGLLAIPASAVDMTGKWTGSVEFKTADGGTDGGGAVCDLKQNGAEITGTAGSEQEQWPIRNGKIEGKDLTMEVVQPRDDGERVYKCDLKLVSEDKIEGSIEFNTPDGAVKGTLVLTRSK
jgi:hypothetical protein